MSRPALIVELCVAAAVAAVALVIVGLGLVTLIAIVVVGLTACSFLIERLTRRPGGDRRG
jgi:hypothetical protein